jgi:hypothetical protein
LLALLPLLLSLLLAFFSLLLTLLAAFLLAIPATARTVMPASGPVVTPTFSPAAPAGLVAAASLSSAHEFLLLLSSLHDGVSCTRSGTGVTPAITGPR